MEPCLRDATSSSRAGPARPAGVGRGGSHGVKSWSLLAGLDEVMRTTYGVLVARRLAA